MRWKTGEDRSHLSERWKKVVQSTRNNLKLSGIKGWGWCQWDSKAVENDDEASPSATARLSEDEMMSLEGKDLDDAYSVHDIVKEITESMDASQVPPPAKHWTKRLYAGILKLWRPQWEKVDSELPGDHRYPFRNEDDDIKSTVFSISTEKNSKQILTNNLLDRIDGCTRVSRDSAHSPLYPMSIQLGDINADDLISVESTCLAVSFDADYPQLVLQKSSSCLDEISPDESTAGLLDEQRDDEEQRNGEDELNDELLRIYNRVVSPSPLASSSHVLGATFPHPVWKKSGEGSEDALSKPSSYLEADHKRLWKNIDESCYSPSDKPLFKRNAVASPTEVDIVRWRYSMEEDEMRWSFQEDESITDLIEKDCLQPRLLFDLRPDCECMDDQPKCDFQDETSSFDRPFDEYD